MVSETFYNELLKYCEIRIFSKKIQDHISSMDLAHDVLCDENFSYSEYKKIVDKYIYLEFKKIKTEDKYTEFQIDKEIIVEELWRCKECNCDFPKSKFHLSWQHCNSCYRKINKERINAVNLKSYYKHHEKRLAEKRAYDKKYRQENLEEIRRKDRERYHNKKTVKKN